MQIAIPPASPGMVHDRACRVRPCRTGGARIGGVRHAPRRGSGNPLRGME
jgi:hypothetical protein